MRIRILLVLFLFTTAPAISRADAAPNWMLVRVDAGSTPASGVIELYGEAPDDGTRGPEAVMIADGSNILTWAGAGPNYQINSTKSTGGLSVDTGVGQESGTFGYTQVDFHFDLQPGQSHGGLLVDTEGDLSVLRYRLYASSGNPIVSVRYGSDATVILLNDPTSDGTGVSVGSLAVGNPTNARTLSSGIVGAMTSFCEMCSGSWTSSDGRSSSWSSSGGPGLGWKVSGGPRGFAGPPGTWNWSWSGVELEQDSVIGPALDGNAVMALYVPVGDDWKLFA